MNLYNAITRHLYDQMGAEALAYDPFIRLYGIRERVGDITRPKVQSLGDIELPRNALYHYLPTLPGEIGPGNQAGAFLYQQKGRINLFFEWDYSTVADPGGIRIKPRDKPLIEAQYFKTHFRFTRIRTLAPYFTKTNELIVVNHAPAFTGVNYLRQTPSQPYAKFCNEMATVIDSINRLADICDRHQFWAIPLPPRFVKIADLKYASRFRPDFFKEDGTFTKVPPDILRKFASGNTWWILELYQFLHAPPSADTIQTSLFSRLTDKARKMCNLVFVWQGQCFIVNVQVLLSLMNYRIDAESTEALSTRRNHFKRFYLNLIALVTHAPVNEMIQEKEEPEEDAEDDSDAARPVDTDDNPTINVRQAEGREVAPVDPPAIVDMEPEADDEQVIDFSQLDILEKPEHVATIPEKEAPKPAAPKWGDVIDDDVLDQLIEADTLVSAQDSYTPSSAIIRALDQRAKEGNLSQREKQFYLNAADAWKEIDIDGIPLEKLIDIKSEDMVMDDVALAKDNPTITDKSALKSRAWVARVGYVKKLMQRNIAEMIVYLQNAQVCVTDVKKKSVTTATSKYDLWSVETLTLEGNKKTLNFRIPRIDSNGEFLINGVKSYMQFQRMEKPVRKVTELAVQLTSYYDKGRIRVERSRKVVDDYARWLQIRLIQASQTRPDVSVKLGQTEYKPKNASYYYSILSARFTEITLGKLTLTMDTPTLLEKFPKAKKWCDENQWCVGESEGRFLVIDKGGMLSWNGEDTIDYLETLAGLPIEKAPLPIATININGYKFPAIVVLCYWMGLKGVLDAIGADYRVVEGTQRVKLAPDEYLVQFADTRLIFQRRHELTTLIVAGLLKFPRLSEFGMSHLEDPNIWFSLVTDERVKPNHFKEMTQLYNMFIDPITKRLLVNDGYPTSMEKLCIAAIKLLLSRYSPSEVEITEQRFVGYERFAGHVYREFSKAARLYRNKPNNGKRTFDLNPEAIILQIITDSSVQAVEEVNPIHQLKQQEEVTFGGTLGRAEQAMVRRTRGMQSNYVGIISEAGKDSGKVGFVSYFSSDPKLVDYYGNINVDLPATKAGMGSVTMNTLYGGTRDDAKRSLNLGPVNTKALTA